MKNNIAIAISTAAALLTGFFVLFPDTPESSKIPPTDFTSNEIKAIRKYPNSATNTETINLPARIVHTLDAAVLGQGTCIKIKDADGGGYTFLTTSKGAATFSAASCE